MTPHLKIILVSFCGLVGTIALTLYFTAPFTWMPLPLPTATTQEILEFGKKYQVAGEYKQGKAISRLLDGFSLDVASVFAKP